jgi:hypothetical protein
MPVRNNSVEASMLWARSVFSSITETAIVGAQLNAQKPQSSHPILLT